MRVSVIIPYNIDRGFLDKAIQSVESQSYKDVEFIDGYGQGTLGQNFNRALKKAKGEFVKILAEDDMLTTRSIEYLVEGIKDADMCTGNAYSIYGGDPTPISKWIGLETDLKRMLVRNEIHGGTVLYRMSGFEKFGCFDESLVTGEEYDLNLKWISKGAKQNNVNKVVYMYRIWGGSKSQHLTRDEDRINYINAIKKRYEF